MLFKTFVIVFFLIPFQIKSISATENAKIEQIFTLVYNQQFDEAENMLKTEQTQLDSFYSRILNLDLYWWKYSLSRSSKDANALKNILDGFSSVTQDTQEERMDELIRLSYKMRYEIKRYNFIGAIIIRSNVRRQIEVLKSEKLNIPAKRLKLFDLYLALFQYFDNAINPFSIESKSSELSASLLLLEKYAQEDDLILSTIAHYFLGRILIKVEKDPEKGWVHFRVLAKRFPKNKLFHDIANGTNTKF
jgi:hypothetical protein